MHGVTMVETHATDGDSERPADPSGTAPRVKLCRCGHHLEHHEHYRRGSDCAVCGPEVCGRFRRDRTPRA